MADWSDLVGITLNQARDRALKYDHDVAVMKIGEQYVTPEVDRTRPTVLVGVNESGNQAIVVLQFGVEQPIIQQPREAA